MDKLDKNAGYRIQTSKYTQVAPVLYAKVFCIYRGEVRIQTEALER